MHQAKRSEGMNPVQCAGAKRRAKNNKPMRTLGTATIVTSATARTVRPRARKARLPPTTAAEPHRMTSHGTMLNESTEPSPKPIKKKYTKIRATTTSIPQGSQNITTKSDQLAWYCEEYDDGAQPGGG